MLAKKFKLPAIIWETQRQQRPLRIVNTPLVSMRSFKTTLPYPRVGVVVGTKVDKKATERNRIRRAIYDAFQTRFDKLPIADYTCMIRSGMKSLKRAEIIKEIEKII